MEEYAREIIEGLNETELIGLLHAQGMPDTEYSKELENKVSNIVEIDELIRSAREKAERARETAGKQVSPNILNQPKALQSTQEAVISMAESQVAMAESQAVLFENQQRFSEGMKFLLEMGVTNLAYNSVTIKTLYNKLKNAEETGLSSLAQEEMKSIIRQLLKQRTVLEQQESLNKKMETLKKNDAEQDQKLVVGAEKDEEHDKKLKEIEILDQTQEKLLQELVETIKQSNEKNKKEVKTFLIWNIILSVFGVASFLLALLHIIE